MKIAVAGHICLDIIPTLGKVPDLGSLLMPGTLTEIGSAVLATGGAVSNTGIALHRLGLQVSLMAKVGDDDFGQTVLNILDRQHIPTDGMIVAPGEASSYSIVINPPGIDRTFLHCPGANHSFRASDINPASLADIDLLHFGYPTLMRTMYQDSGAEMKTLFERARQAGAITSLDMTCVDPASEAGQVDWFQWLENVLPSVDLFLPSIDEILFMANRPKYDELAGKFPGDIMQGIDAKLVEQTAQTLLELGVSVAIVKLGKEGLYLRTGNVLPGKGAGWGNASLFMPCLEADTVGTTGAGDCTIAGFLAGFVKGGTPEQVAESASSIGGLSTEAADATSAIPHWDAVQQKISKGWKRLDSKFY